MPGANAAGSTSAGATGGSLPAGTYTNPVPGASTGRIDQGVDYTLSSSGFLAPGKSQILIANANDSGWGGGGYIAAKLLDGPLAGDVYYVAEGVKPVVKAGDIVQAGQQLVTRVTNPFNGTLGNIEAGWANPNNPGQPIAQTLSGYSGDQSSQALTAGYAFSNFVTALGGIAGQFQGAGASLAGSIENLFKGGTPAGVPY